MTPQEAEAKLGFQIIGDNLEFSDRDHRLMGRTVKDAEGNNKTVDFLGTSRSGARPASPQEKAMWALLTAPEVADDKTN